MGHSITLKVLQNHYKAMVWSTSLRHNYWKPRKLNKMLHIQGEKNPADLKRRGGQGFWQRKSRETRAPDQPPSPVKHVLKGMETHPPRQLSALQDGLAFSNSLPKAAFSMVLSRAGCTNNT